MPSGDRQSLPRPRHGNERLVDAAGLSGVDVECHEAARVVAVPKSRPRRGFLDMPRRRNRASSCSGDWGRNWGCDGFAGIRRGRRWST